MRCRRFAQSPDLVSSLTLLRVVSLLISFCRFLFFTVRVTVFIAQQRRVVAC